MLKLESPSTRVEELQEKRAKYCTVVHCLILTKHTKKLYTTWKQIPFTAFKVCGVYSGGWKWSKPSMDKA